MSRNEHLDLEVLRNISSGSSKSGRARSHGGTSKNARSATSSSSASSGSRRSIRTTTWPAPRNGSMRGESSRTHSARSIAPSAAGNARARKIRFFRASRAARWLVPAAVMVAGVVMIAYFAKREESRERTRAARHAGGRRSDTISSSWNRSGAPCVTDGIQMEIGAGR